MKALNIKDTSPISMSDESVLHNVLVCGGPATTVELA